MGMVGVHFVTFGSYDYKPQVDRITQEALRTGWFTSIRAHLPEHLDPVFREKHSAMLHGRGYGYWIWKPQILRQVFDTIPDGDVVVYADAGCTINPKASIRFKVYLQLVETHPTGIVCFQMHYLERHWTKREVFDRLGFEHANTGQICATYMILRKCATSQALLDRWSELTQDYSLIDDTKGSQDPEFRDHRHDQSIWSLLNKQYGTCALPEDEGFPPGRREYPFWGTRIRGSQASPYTGKLRLLT